MTDATTASNTMKTLDAEQAQRLTQVAREPGSNTARHLIERITMAIGVAANAGWLHIDDSFNDFEDRPPHPKIADLVIEHFRNQGYKANCCYNFGIESYSRVAARFIISWGVAAQGDPE